MKLIQEWSDFPDVMQRHAAHNQVVIAFGGVEQRLGRIGLDIEFPRADGELLMRDPRRGLLALLRRRRAAAQVAVAERAYAALVDEIHAGGRRRSSLNGRHCIARNCDRHGTWPVAITSLPKSRRWSRIKT